MYNTREAFAGILIKREYQNDIENCDAISDEIVQEILRNTTVEDFYLHYKGEFVAWQLPEQTIYLMVVEHPIHNTDAGIVVVEESGKVHLLHIDNFYSLMGYVVEEARKMITDRKGNKTCD